MLLGLGPEPDSMAETKTTAPKTMIQDMMVP